MPQESLPPAALFRVMELLVREKRRITEIADLVNQEYQGVHLTRERIYPLLTRALESGFVRLIPPLEDDLARKLETRFDCPTGTIRVVDCPSRGSNASVSAAAAVCAVDLLADLSGTTKAPIGVGLGPGRATLDFAREFSLLLASDPSMVLLNLIAISAGCPAHYPEYSSISFFNLFQSRNVAARTGLFAETLVPNDDLERIRDLPGVREAFQAKKKDKISLVVTSMGDARCPHALLNLFYEECKPKPACVEERVGDVQYRPFSNKGFIREGPKDFRAVTLFELEDLVQLSQRKNRYVILIARQCGACTAPPLTKAEPLRPLLENPDMRVFSHLVTDTPTARELLAK